MPKFPGYENKSPGNGFEWRGTGDAENNNGAWFNPETKEIFHWDLNHPKPEQPHWDYKIKGKGWKKDIVFFQIIIGKEKYLKIGENYMSESINWAEKYGQSFMDFPLKNLKFKKEVWTSKEHEHCLFCGKEITNSSFDYPTEKQGYASTTECWWACKSCFEKFIKKYHCL